MIQYIQGWFVNFLIIFFANHMLPGISVKVPAKLPHIGGDLLFAMILALLNSCVLPVLRFLDRSLPLPKLILTSVILNFAAYALLKFLPIDLHVESVEGYLLATIVVTTGSILAHLREMKKRGFASHEVSTHKSEPPRE
jgi:uncharacterized membrane protein YvlD (DUF360 family)